MLGILADHADYAFPLDDLALIAHLFNAGSYFHGSNSLVFAS